VKANFAPIWPPVVISELLKYLSQCSLLDRYVVRTKEFKNVVEQTKEAKHYHYFARTHWYFFNITEIAKNCQLQDWKSAMEIFEAETKEKDLEF